jgi:hypothetical protein
LKAKGKGGFYWGATGHFGQGGSTDPYARAEAIFCIAVGDHEWGLGIDRGQRMAAVPPWNNDLRGYRNNKTGAKGENRGNWSSWGIGFSAFPGEIGIQINFKRIGEGITK